MLFYCCLLFVAHCYILLKTWPFLKPTNIFKCFRGFFSFTFFLLFILAPSYVSTCSDPSEWVSSLGATSSTSPSYLFGSSASKAHRFPPFCQWNHRSCQARLYIDGTTRSSGARTSLSSLASIWSCFAAFRKDWQAVTKAVLRLWCIFCRAWDSSAE